MKKVYERYDANYCLVFVIYCLDTTLLVCLLYVCNICLRIYCFHTNNKRLCSSTLSGHPSSSYWENDSHTVCHTKSAPCKQLGSASSKQQPPYTFHLGQAASLPKPKSDINFPVREKKGVLWCWPVPDAGDCSRPACDYQIKKCLQICSGQFPSKISLGGIPDSCNVLFLQTFLKRAAKPSARNTSAGFPWVKWPQILLNVPWLCTKASQTFSDFFSGTLLNLLRNPVERDLALHQSLPDLR